MQTTLLHLETGKKAKIKRLEGGYEFQRKLATLNIRVGKVIRKVANQPFKGPSIVEVGDRKVTLGRGMTQRIFVEETE